MNYMLLCLSFAWTAHAASPEKRTYLPFDAKDVSCEFGTFLGIGWVNYLSRGQVIYHWQGTLGYWTTKFGCGRAVMFSRVNDVKVMIDVVDGYLNADWPEGKERKLRVRWNRATCDGQDLMIDNLPVWNMETAGTCQARVEAAKQIDGDLSIDFDSFERGEAVQVLPPGS